MPKEALECPKFSLIFVVLCTIGLFYAFFYERVWFISSKLPVLARKDECKTQMCPCVSQG